MAGERAGTEQDVVASGNGGTAAPTVRDATFDVLRALGPDDDLRQPRLDRGPLLAGLPDDLRFVLALHEGSVVGMATGFAIGRGEPALRPPAHHRGAGQRRRRARHRPRQSRAARRHRRPAGPPAPRAGAVPRRAPGRPGRRLPRLGRAARPRPGRARRARPRPPRGVERPRPRAGHRADGRLARARARGRTRCAGPDRLLRAGAAAPAAVDELAALLEDGALPGARGRRRRRHPDTWAALVALAERLSCPVWQEAFGARAGFPQDHPLFAGHLPPGRARLRAMLGGHDVILAVGAPVFRQYAYEPGPLVNPGTRLALVTDDPAEAHRSPSRARGPRRAGAVCRGLVGAAAGARDGPRPGAVPRRPRRRRRRRPASRCAPATCFAALAERLPADAVLVEESPSSRPELHARVPARAPLGFVSAAMGGLGFALPGDDRPAHGAARPPRGRGPSATARRCTRSRPCGARRARASARCSSSWPTGATRSWTASPSSTRPGRRRGRRSRPSTSPRSRAAWAAPRAHRGPRRAARTPRRGPPGAGAPRRAPGARDRRLALTLEQRAA